MRAILPLSLTQEKKENLVNRAKKANKTTSAYILAMVDLVDSLISEEELLKRSQEAEKNYKQGKAKKLKSLADLMN